MTWSRGVALHHIVEEGLRCRQRAEVGPYAPGLETQVETEEDTWIWEDVLNNEIWWRPFWNR